MICCQTDKFGRFAACCKFGCSTRLASGRIQVWDGTGTDDRHVPDSWLARRHGMSIMSSGRFPSVRLRPAGCLDTGMPAAENALATTSLRAWCRAVLPGACLQTKLCRPLASTGAPQRHWCGTQRLRPKRRPTATLTASSSSFKPQDTIGRANSQSSLWRDVAAK